MKYEILKNGYIKTIGDAGNEIYIPNDPANSDYQEYLKYLENNK